MYLIIMIFLDSIDSSDVFTFPAKFYSLSVVVVLILSEFTVNGHFIEFMD